MAAWRERSLGLWEGCAQAVRLLGTRYWGGRPEPKLANFGRRDGIVAAL